MSDLFSNQFFERGIHLQMAFIRRLKEGGLDLGRQRFPLCPSGSSPEPQDSSPPCPPASGAQSPKLWILAPTFVSESS